MAFLFWLAGRPANRKPCRTELPAVYFPAPETKSPGTDGVGMGSFPWGPHGPETSPNQVKPNPTAAQPVGPFGQAGDGNAFPTAGPGGGGANPFLSFTVSILMVPLVWMFWICLYPLTATAA